MDILVPKLQFGNEIKIKTLKDEQFLSNNEKDNAPLAIHELQQELQAKNEQLQQECARREQAEQALQTVNEQLEERVKARTAELENANARLKEEIAKRKEVEAALREAELRYRTVANFTYDWEYWETPAGTLSYVSPSCERITGYTAEQFIDNPHLIHEITLAEDRDIWDQHRYNAFESSEARAIQFRIQKRNGEIRWIEHMCLPVTDDQDTFLGFRASNRDITERKQAQEELRKHRDDLEGLLAERATDLVEANEQLQREITERLNAEKSLREAKEAAELARNEEQERRREAERRRQIAESLGDFLTVLNSDRSLDEILDYITTQTNRLLGTDANAIYRHQGGADDAFTLLAAQGRWAEKIAQAEVPLGHRALREAILTGQPVAVSDVTTTPTDQADLVSDSTQQSQLADLAGRYPALLAMPLIIKEAVYGGIILYYRTPRTFSGEEILLAVIFSDQVALAIENARLKLQAEEAAAVAERNRLAHDLHDAVSQTLFSATAIAEALPRVWERHPEAGQRGLETLSQLTRAALAEMRTLLLELRPAALTEKKLSELLRQLTDAMMGRTRVPVTMTAVGDYPLPAEVQVTLYRIAQEALNNIAKHARANQATVALDCQPEQVVLRISDNGDGFDSRAILPHQMGLSIMQERAEAIGAIFKIESELSQGTQITVTWKGSY